MIQWLNSLVIRTSRTGWLFLISAAVAIGSFQVMSRIAAQFPAEAGGALPFDLQNTLTVADVMAQLPHYTLRARHLYEVFTTFDYFFPFFAALTSGALVAFSLRRSTPGFYQTLVSRHLFALFFLGTLFDWGENVGCITVILEYPTQLPWMALLLVISKRLKLFFVILTNISLLVSLVLLAVHWARRPWRTAV